MSAIAELNLATATPAELEKAGVQDAASNVTFVYHAWKEDDFGWAAEGWQSEEWKNMPTRPDHYSASRGYGIRLSRRTGRPVDSDKSRTRVVNRFKQREETNWAFFKERVLPEIAERLNPWDWQDIAKHRPAGSEDEIELFRRGGWELAEWTAHEGHTHREWYHATLMPIRAAILRAIVAREPVAGRLNPLSLPFGYVPENGLFVWKAPDAPTPS